MQENIIIQSVNLLKLRLDFFLNLLCEHIALSLSSVAIAFVLGLFLAVFINEKPKFAKLILNFINFVYIVPAISLLGLFIPFFGIGNTSAIIALSLYALLPMVQNSYTALRQTPQALLEVAHSLGLSPLQILMQIKLPLAFNAIISSLRTMLIMTIALAGIAAFIGAGGLGVAIYRGITTNNAALIVVGSLLMIILALVFDLLLNLIQKYTQVSYKIKMREKGAFRLFWLKKFGIFLGILLAVILSFFAMLNDNKNQITIASKPMSEQYIITEMLKILIEQDLGVKVSLVQGVGGGTANIDIGMQSGDFELYTEYTGTAWGAVMKRDGVYNEAKFSELESFYKRRGMSLLAPFGFNNTFGIAVKRELADKFGLKTYSDLAKVSSQLSFGAEYDFFDRIDGYLGLVGAYNFAFKKTYDLDIGLKYEALKSGKVDAINVFTTDARLNDEDIMILQDDLNFYPSYLAINVARNELFIKFPALKDTLLKLEGLIDDKTMARLNSRVELDKIDAKSVAREFLKEKNLLK